MMNSPSMSGPTRHPKVTVGLPVYNGERFLAAAVTSLLEQSLEDIEVVLADNASTDGTAAICREFAAADQRVRVLSSARNLGAAWNFNRCLDAARGEYFKWAAHDDLYDPEYLAACIAVLDSEPDVVLCYTQAVEIDDDGNELFRRGPVNVADLPASAARYRAVVFDEVFCYAIFGVVRTAVLRSTRAIEPYSASDRALLAELALHGRLVELEAPYFLHREHLGRSMYAYVDDRARMAWFDPRLDGRRTMPQWRLGRGYAGGLWRAGRAGASPGPAGWRTLAEWAVANRRPLSRQLAHRALLAVRRSPTPVAGEPGGASG
jgi:glycosyltransferase involved in cell wall biosynthesis